MARIKDHNITNSAADGGTNTGHKQKQKKPLQQKSVSLQAYDTMTVTRTRTMSMYLGLVTLLLAPAHAFTGHTTTTTTHSIQIAPCPTLRRSSPCQHQHSKHLILLHAQDQEPSPADDELSNGSSSTNSNAAAVAAAATSQYDDGDPRQALEQFGSLFSQVQAIFLEGSNWDEETLEIKTEEFVRTYLRVFVPGIGYAATSFAVFGSTFASVLLIFSLSGRGYTDVLTAVNEIDFLRGLLEKADPAWGNAAIALLGCEVLSPVILAVTLALTPKTMGALQGKLNEWGWGEDDIDKRTAEILNLTT